MVPAYAAHRQAYAEDRDFGQDIEALVPSDSFVFQLPYGEFPEGLWTPAFADIDLLRPLSAHAAGGLELRQPARSRRRGAGPRRRPPCRRRGWWRPSRRPAQRHLP